MTLTVGDVYETKDTPFLRLHGIIDGVNYAVVHISDDKVSLYLKYANGKQAPDKLTICAGHFGGNFEPTQYIRNSNYAVREHYFPKVNPQSNPIWPSYHSKH